MAVTAPSPLAGEGFADRPARSDRVRGVVRHEDTPHPICACGFFLEPSPARGEGTVTRAPLAAPRNCYSPLAFFTSAAVSGDTDSVSITIFASASPVSAGPR